MSTHSRQNRSPPHRNTGFQLSSNDEFAAAMWALKNRGRAQGTAPQTTPSTTNNPARTSK